MCLPAASLWHPLKAVQARRRLPSYCAANLRLLDLWHASLCGLSSTWRLGDLHMAGRRDLNDECLLRHVHDPCLDVLLEGLPVLFRVRRGRSVPDRRMRAVMGSPSRRRDEPVWLPIEDLSALRKPVCGSSSRTPRGASGQRRTHGDGLKGCWKQRERRKAGWILRFGGFQCGSAG
ncbi:hypothetical protein VTI74DRAFT_10346 [Chaetomium olivicolor]